MNSKLLITLLAIFMLAACASPNDHDYHAGDSTSHEQSDTHPDTIMGRAPDSTNVITDSTNVGAGDTTLERTH